MCAGTHCNALSSFLAASSAWAVRSTDVAGSARRDAALRRWRVSAAAAALATCCFIRAWCLLAATCNASMCWPTPDYMQFMVLHCNSMDLSCISLWGEGLRIYCKGQLNGLIAKSHRYCRPVDEHRKLPCIASKTTQGLAAHEPVWVDAYCERARHPTCLPSSPACFTRASRRSRMTAELQEGAARVAGQVSASAGADTAQIW